MTPGPRDYATGTERALFHVARGTCYFPDCAVPVVSEEKGHFIVGVEIAHIRGANPGSPRYDASQTDDERRDFKNLVLLCNKHHKLVDKLAPGSYPVETLESWKAANEPEAREQVLSISLSEADLEAVLARAYVAATPRREVEVDVLGGIVINEREVLGWDLNGLDLLLGENPELWRQPRVVIADIRNVGSADVSVEQVDFILGATQESTPHDLRLAGRNDFGESNPPLPYRLLSGDAVRWFTKLDTFAMIAKGLEGAAEPSAIVDHLRALVRLASGEVVESARAPWKFGTGWPDDQVPQE